MQAFFVSLLIVNNWLSFILCTMKFFCQKHIIGLVLFFTVFATHAGEYFKSDRLIFDLYTPSWVNTPSVINSSFSLGFSTSWGKDIVLSKSRYSCFYGLGYDFANINSNVDFKRSFKGSSIRSFGLKALHGVYAINQLTSHYLEVPLELRFRTQTKIPFRVYLGTKVGYLVKSKYTLDENTGTTFERKNINILEDLKYGVSFRVGYGLINFYTYYGFNSLIRASKQPGINQISFGISFLAN